MKYFLFAFGNYQSNAQLACSIAQQVAHAASGEVKYSYGDQNLIIYFNSDIEYDLLSKYVSYVMGTSSAMHFMMPCTNNMSMSVPDDIKSSFFGKKDPVKAKIIGNVSVDELDQILSEIVGEDTEGFDTHMSEVEKIIQENQNQDMYVSEDEDDDDDLDLTDLLIEEPKKKVVEGPTLDEILDKISSKGMKSLTKKELELLKKYSDQ